MDAPAETPIAPPAPAPRMTPKDAWRLALAGGLAFLMTLAGLALAFGWTRFERALDVRALFR